MINVKYPRRGFVVEEVTEGCKTEGCSAKKLVVLGWEYYGEHDFNELTEGMTIGQNICDDDNEGECSKCGKPVYFKRHFIVTSDANTLKTAYEAFAYANYVLKAPFPEGEALIATSVDNSYRYAKWVLKAPFELGEKIIATDPYHSYHYAKDILHAPFPLGEAAIATDVDNFKMYKELFPEPQVVEPAPIKPIEVRTGVILQEVTEGCSCEKYVVYEGCVAKEGDAWTDFTEGLKVGEMSIVKDNTGECPKCGKDIKFKEYYIVTNIS